jgi:hypothetical protein
VATDSLRVLLEKFADVIAAARGSHYRGENQIVILPALTGQGFGLGQFHIEMVM